MYPSANNVQTVVSIGKYLGVVLNALHEDSVQETGVSRSLTTLSNSHASHPAHCTTSCKYNKAVHLHWQSAEVRNTLVFD